MAHQSDFPIVSKLGGWPAVEEALKARDISTTKQVIANWRSRGRLPRDAALCLAEEASCRGTQIEAGDFKINRKTEPCANLSTEVA